MYHQAIKLVFCTVVLLTTLSNAAKDDWITFGKKQYKLIERTVTSFEEAVTACSNYGGIIPEPKDLQENKLLSTVGSKDAFYLGMKDDITEGQWLWHSDRSNVSYSDWHIWPKTSEPNGGTSENCNVMASAAWKDAKGHRFEGWVDVPCDGKFNSLVCERNDPGADIKFEITPKTFKPLLTDNLTMRCGITSATTQPSSIVITKDGVRVATVSPQSPASYFGNSSDVKVTSQLSGNSGFIQLVFNYPSEHQSGSYQCDVALLDQRGHHHDVSKTANVTRDIVTFVDLIEGIRHLNKEKDKLNNLMQNITQSQDTRFTAIEQRMNKHVYFSVGLTLDKTLSPRPTLIYNKVFINIGDGYNRNTGKFTCPVAGDYLFLMHGSGRRDERISLYMMHNGNRVIHLYTMPRLEAQSASTSGVISLAKGDTVYVQSGGTSYLYGWPSPTNTFTGLLLSSA